MPASPSAGDHQEKIQIHLKILREERETLLGFKLSREKRSQEYLKKTQTEREKIVSEFQQLRKFLVEQEQLLLAQLENLDKKIMMIENENLAKLSEEISCLGELISETEGKCQKPASEFLQDVRSTLSSYEKGKFQEPVEISPELENSISDFSQKNITLMETLRKIKDTLCSELKAKIEETLRSYRQVKVTLDPDTAHPNLILSEDWKTVKWGKKWHNVPEDPERFDSRACVLGCEGFTSGRHYWEVEVGDGVLWAVGVARESVRRKGWISPNPEGGIWAMGQWEEQFQALTSPESPLPLSWVPRKIRVSLDYERGQVTFFDAGNEAPIFTFPPASFTGEKICPWLWVGPGSQLRLCH
ncbi:E3 ubiquitin-protein ligase TRIM15-like isoform X2 [Emydura macquarii macquarii]|uniref:E3 ubiquitin-protein ligase TRIM15-like isoform X2 n=1 Tax=Emydura macquarii macquarii TaxID=1129001 RepID=UPI00352A4216